jgi:hypothetical protein
LTGCLSWLFDDENTVETALRFDAYNFSYITGNAKVGTRFYITAISQQIFVDTNSISLYDSSGNLYTSQGNRVSMNVYSDDQELKDRLWLQEGQKKPLVFHIERVYSHFELISVDGLPDKKPEYTKTQIADFLEVLSKPRETNQLFVTEGYIWLSYAVNHLVIGRLPKSHQDAEKNAVTCHWDYERLGNIDGFFDEDKTYTVYFRVYAGDSYGALPMKVDGLMTIEEKAAREAEKKAAQEAEAEAKRKAIEEANKYDASKFVIVPSNFKPAEYTKADLFAAVAASEKMDSAAIFGTYVYTPSKNFVSDVVFVSQSGTDIIFKTADNAISQRMKVDSRTNLTAGQKVRIYYTAYRINSWQVHAIERL